MVKQYRSREGEATAIDTKTQLTTMGPDTAPGPLNVPQGFTKLLGCFVAAIGNGAATGAASSFVRLEGGGLTDGPIVIAGPCMGGSVATGQAIARPAMWYPLDVQVEPGNEIIIFGEFCGADIGQMSFGVTLVFGA